MFLGGGWSSRTCNCMETARSHFRNSTGELKRDGRLRNRAKRQLLPGRHQPGWLWHTGNTWQGCPQHYHLVSRSSRGIKTTNEWKLPLKVPVALFFFSSQSKFISSSDLARCQFGKYPAWLVFSLQSQLCAENFFISCSRPWPWKAIGLCRCIHCTRN